MSQRQKTKRYTYLFATSIFIIIIGKEALIKNEYIDPKSDLEEANCLLFGTQERGAYCNKKKSLLDGGSYLLDGQVCRRIEELIGDSSIADFGAGLGQYGRCFTRKTSSASMGTDSQYRLVFKHILDEMKRANLVGTPAVLKSWEGFDGGTNIEDLSENFVKHLELSKPFDLGKTYDWVMSLEVGEHIPEQYEDIFIDNIIRHAHKGIILSWAIPKQVGKNHVNLKSNDDVIKAMIKKGVTHDQKSQEFLRQNSTFFHFRTNLMVFRKVPAENN